MFNLPEDFCKRMERQLGAEYPLFIASYNKAATKGIRVNNLKISTEDFIKISPFSLTPISWAENGFYVDEEKLGKTLAYAAGLYYPQEPSAMSAVPYMKIQGNEKVLDLCAAPGGKSTQIASYLGGKGLLVTNEIDSSRTKILAQNIERAGVSNALVTNKTPQKLAQIFPAFFDKILVDAPCSGEGMFKKEPSAISCWNVKNVMACAERQAEILECAYQMLVCGGTLVYSTCTFSPEEDELQIQNFVRNHADCQLKEQRKLYPHHVLGEGHFVAVLQKHGEAKRHIFEQKKVKEGSAMRAYREWESATLKTQLNNLYADNNCIYTLPVGLPNMPTLEKLGLNNKNNAIFVCPKGDGKHFEPTQALAMRLTSEDVNTLAATQEQALSYLHGLTLECNLTNGWYVVTYMNYPLGWCKVVNGIAKNHYPKGLRI